VFVTIVTPALSVMVPFQAPSALVQAAAQTAATSVIHGLSDVILAGPLKGVCVMRERYVAAVRGETV
jgi:hypothetical protein